MYDTIHMANNDITAKEVAQLRHPPHQPPLTDPEEIRWRTEAARAFLRRKGIKPTGAKLIGGWMVQTYPRDQVLEAIANAPGSGNRTTGKVRSESSKKGHAKRRARKDNDGNQH